MSSISSRDVDEDDIVGGKGCAATRRTCVDFVRGCDQTKMFAKMKKPKTLTICQSSLVEEGFER